MSMRNREISVTPVVMKSKLHTIDIVKPYNFEFLHIKKPKLDLQTLVQTK